MANPSPPETRLSARTLTTLPAILTSLSEIEALESSLSSSLSNLVASQQPIIDSLTRLQSLVPHVEELTLDANLLADKVGGTAQTAQRVGGKVRVLDEEMRRVKDASERVAAVTELKLSLADLHSSIEAQDWETATRHCARAMAVPPEIIKGPFAESVVPTADLPLPPSETLQEAREKLLRIFRVEFGKASQARDSANTSRFFKLFPAIGWEKEGLEAYSGFVVDLVRGRATVSGKSSSPLYYITTLTSLFESIALIVDQHQPVVEKYYGSGKMLSVVARLLQECDRVVGGLIESWEEERQMQRKVQDIQNPYFPALVPQTQRRGAQVSEDDGPDPREIDKVLTEVAGLVGRWALFRRFLTDRLKEEHESAPQSPDGTVTEDEVDKTTEAKLEPTSTEPESSTSPEVELIESTGCRSMMAQLISTYYIPLEKWYLRSVIDKAHRVSAPDSSEPPQTTTPDDVFYILKLVISRLLTTGSVDCVERMTQVITGILEKDLAGVIRRKMEDIYSPSAQNARGNAAQREKTERENRNAFIIQLNDLDISSAHMETLIKNVLASPQIQQNFLETDVAPTQEHVSSMLKLTTKFQSVLKWGVEQLFNQLARPKLRSLVVEVYKDVSYMLDDDSYASAEYQDVVRKRFVKAWDALVDGFKDTFTERNYRAFFSLAVEVLVRPWEKHILSMKFTELGAIRFDKDLRSITAYLSTQTAFGDTREKFLRLQQISTILNLDLEEDPDEFYSSSGISWKLSQNEARVAASLRVSYVASQPGDSSRDVPLLLTLIAAWTANLNVLTASTTLTTRPTTLCTIFSTMQTEPESSSDALASTDPSISESSSTTTIPSPAPDAKQSPPIHQDFITYEFCFDAFNGPLTQRNDPRALYIILTPTTLLGRETTVVTRRDGQVVGEIRPRSLLKKQKIKINGKECKDLLKKGDGKLVGTVGKSCWWFEDGDGRAFYWKDLMCYDANGRVVARYTRQIDRPSEVSNDDKARLSVDKAYTAPITLDYILFTALRMELKRRDTERAFGHQPQMKRDRPRQTGSRPRSTSLPKATNIEGAAHAPRRRAVTY